MTHPLSQLTVSRLKAQPELETRLRELLALRRLTDKPALVVQTRPLEPLTLNVYEPPVSSHVRGGVDDTNWSWDGFFAGNLKPVFHGVAASKDTWCFEAHGDGHFIAAIWDFPLMNKTPDEQVLAVPDYYAHFIRHFFGHVSGILKAADVKAAYCATATLLKANELSYVAYLAGQKSRIAAQPPALDTLQWPVRSAEVASEAWYAICRDMAEGLCGAYGHRSPLTRFY